MIYRMMNYMVQLALESMEVKLCCDDELTLSQYLT